MSRTVFALIAWAAASVAIAATSPALVKADYAVFKDGLNIATVEETYEKNGEQYRIESDSNPAGVLAMFVRTKVKVKSSGTITPAGLQPEKLEYGRLDDASKNVGAVFDWRAQQLHLNYDGRNETLP